MRPLTLDLPEVIRRSRSPPGCDSGVGEEFLEHARDLGASESGWSGTRTRGGKTSSGVPADSASPALDPVGPFGVRIIPPGGSWRRLATRSPSFHIDCASEKGDAFKRLQNIALGGGFRRCGGCDAVT